MADEKLKDVAASVGIRWGTSTVEADPQPMVGERVSPSAGQKDKVPHRDTVLGNGRRAVDDGDLNRLISDAGT